ncbi:MAG TPA: hypothetical protein VGH27_06350 [Streptosporangiaceae bacterium]
MTLTPRARQLIAAGLLGAVCCVWAAAPLHGTGQDLLLVAGAVCVAGDLIRLLAAETAVDTGDVLVTTLKRIWLWCYAFIRQVPWAEGTVLAALVLEALHSSRAWHTGLLAVALLCYLLATHLAESHAQVRVLRRQVPVLAGGLGVLVIAAGAAALPAAGTGLASGLLRVLAALAAVAVAAVVLPVS